MRSEGFGCWLGTRINGDEGLAFELIDDEVVEFAFIIGGIGNEERALFKAVNTLEFFNEFTRDFGVSNVVWQSNGD